MTYKEFARGRKVTFKCYAHIDDWPVAAITADTTDGIAEGLPALIKGVDIELKQQYCGEGWQPYPRGVTEQEESTL